MTDEEVWVRAYCTLLPDGDYSRADMIAWADHAVEDFRKRFPVPPLDPLAPDAEMEAIAGMTEEQLEAGVARIGQVTGWAGLAAREAGTMKPEHLTKIRKLLEAATEYDEEADDDMEPICWMCGDVYRLRDGKDATKFCDDCAQTIAEDAVELLQEILAAGKAERAREAGR